MGLLWGLLSVLMTSAAQLSLGFAMASLPPMLHPVAFIAALFADHASTIALFSGLLGYLASVFCWHNALHHLELSKAYALLSLSYILVWIASMVLPGMQGAFSLKALPGVACIMAGLMMIFIPSARRT
ncbi:4-amino-4-deoxy-L-arabinose-phospho-UDP flippase [Citrobacter sp. NCU1]|uniref:4-amino-4-deoxy-L-arabinose-phosphoundecaprenol flippase subunit ArnF n=1 Tax=Citrobacter sp. NCU1 TaxID=2026683 RepID=UPI0013918A23|nr:4-amino-4-deoxy-L-arabinose-phosphoundecaprenol flippase subunit ArnF [Citrobacter sp. NCU1]NDO83070.1 4-amino-4-deoxy-L-arabinose-phospho-UDP flippase [Citrobacter sp. NCU1]